MSNNIERAIEEIDPDHNEELKRKKFKDQQGVVNRISQKGGFQAYVENTNPLKEAFYPEKKSGEFELIRAAGSAILLPEAELTTFIDQLAESKGCVCCMDERLSYPKYDRKEGLVASWHRGCGAVKIVCKNNGIDLKDADAKAEQWANELAKKITEKTGKEVNVIEMEVQNPPFHYARTLYYDGTGKFNNKRVEKLPLPEGLIVGRKNMSDTSALTEVSAGIDIMFGDHGFGELFTQTDPFILVAVGNTKNHMEELMTELKKALDEKIALKPELDNKIVVQGFIKPA